MALSEPGAHSATSAGLDEKTCRVARQLRGHVKATAWGAPQERQVRIHGRLVGGRRRRHQEGRQLPAFPAAARPRRRRRRRCRTTGEPRLTGVARPRRPGAGRRCRCRRGARQRRRRRRGRRLRGGRCGRRRRAGGSGRGGRRGGQLEGGGAAQRAGRGRRQVRGARVAQHEECLHQRQHLRGVLRRRELKKLLLAQSVWSARHTARPRPLSALAPAGPHVEAWASE